MIKLESVTKQYGNLKAVDNLDLQISAGVFFGLLGPNGAGKTTLIRMLIGLAKPSSGKVYIGNMEVERNNNKQKGMIGVVPQHTNLDKELTVRENLIFCGKLHRIPPEERKKRIDKLLDFIDLKEAEHRLSQKLSGGMQRKLMIAKALINDPAILFLDEPTVGIDLNARRNIWDILKAMKDRGKTIIMTTHYIEEAEYLCDRVALMNEGKIFFCDTPENLRKQLGNYTLEYFNQDKKTEYLYFKKIEEAKDFAAGLKTNFTIRETTLEDVFYNFTNRKVM